MPSLIEIGMLVLEKKIFFNINICKYSFPYCSPSRPLGTMIWTILNLHYIRKLSCNMAYSGSVVLEKKIFKWPHPIFAFLRLSPLWRGPGPLFDQFRIPSPQGWFMISLIEIDIFGGPCTPILWFVFPFRLTRLITDSYFCHFIGLLVLQKKIFKNFQCIFTLLWLSPLGEFEGQSPTFEQIRIPSPQGWFVPSLVKIGPVVLEKLKM
jgi:hypothetical protein